jgi:SAM-dependent methyltransferase
MLETEKTKSLRDESFSINYLTGKVLDIGAGGNLICPWATEFDIKDGDANRVDEYFPKESFDTVASSHCLEHMVDALDALSRWWKLVKKGGYLIIVVPEENLYEQGIWPSIFNADHKHTFRQTLESSWSPVSINILEACKDLDQARIVSCEIHDLNYDYSLLIPRNNIKINQSFIVKLTFRIIRLSKGKPRAFLEKKFENFLTNFGYPLDQTMRSALAQIQIVVKKA